jgi:hypothetical protein
MIEFRNERVASEWAEAIDNGRLIVPVVLWADALAVSLGAPGITLTNILRTPQEQIDLCRQMGVEPYRSVHEFWRGVDFSCAGLSDTMTEIIGGVNLMYRYGGTFVVAAYHSAGTAPHVHLQVPNGSVWRV